MIRQLVPAMAAATLLAAATPAQAQWRIGAALGAEHESSWDEFLLVTVEARRAMSPGGPEVAPRLSYFLRDGETRYQIDVNLIKPLILATPLRVTPYLGLGGALESISGDNFDGQTAVGFNYVMGVSSRSEGKIEWYGQFQYSVLQDSFNTAVVSLGLLYRLGG